MSECGCDFPVVLSRARKAFGRAVKQLDAAIEKHGDYLKAHAVAYREAQNPATFFGWSFGRYVSLLEEASRMRSLHDLSLRVTRLRLTRNEICLMAEAERTDYMAMWDATVEALKVVPFPEPFDRAKWDAETFRPYTVLMQEAKAHVVPVRKSLIQKLWDSL